MNISRKAGFLLSTAVCMDLFLTGGTVSLAGTGIATILQALPDVGGNVLCGLATNHLSKEPALNKQLEEAFQKSISQTIESVKNDFIEKNNLKTDWWRQKSIEYGFSIPELKENYTLNKSLEDHFFLPLEKALQDETRIKKILEANQQLDPAALIEKVLGSETICLPEFRKKHEEGVRKALIDGFRERFRFHLLQNIHKSEPARKAYQTQLLENSVSYLNKIGQNVNSLLDIVKLLDSKLSNIEKSVLENREKASAESQELRKEILEQWALKLTRNQVRTTDIRDQFSFKSLYTTFQGRYHAIETLTDFLMDGRKFLFYAISGPGGSGKSRLANEICLRAGEVGWIAGFSDQDKNQHFEWHSFKPRADTLIVFDYVKSEKEKVGGILETLASLSEQNKFEYKVRVILLEREFDEDLRQSLFNSKTRSHYFSYVLNEEEKPYELGNLEEEARWEIIKQVISESDEQEMLTSIIFRKKEILAELDKQDLYKRPLFAFFTAVALREGVDVTGWNTNDNLTYHLNRLETKVWNQNKLWADETLRNPIKNLIWLGAILEYLNFEDLEKIRGNSLFKKLDEQWEDSLFWRNLESLFKLDGSKDQKDGFPGIKPDLLAEFFICKHIESLQKVPILKKQLNELFSLSWEIAPERVWWMSWLTFSNYLELEKSSLTHYLSWLESDCEHDSIYLGTLFFSLGNLSNRQGNPQKAEVYYLKAIGQGNVRALNNLAVVFKVNHKPEKAEDYFLKAIELGDVKAPYNLANLHKEQGKLDEAEEYYLQAIEKGQVGALHNLAFLYQEQGRPVEAEKYYLQAIEKGIVDVFYNLAVLYRDQDKFDEAEQYFLKAIGKGVVDALYHLALLYREQDNPEKAVEYYLQAIEKGNVEALYNLAILYKEQGKLDEAEKYYLQAIEKGQVGALHNLAFLYQEQGRPVEAEKYYLQAIEKGIVDVLYNLAVLYRDQDKLDEAEQYFLKAIAQGFLIAFNSLANLYSKQGKPGEAEKYYLQAIEKGHVGALFNLAILYQEQDKLDEAEKYFLKAIEKGFLIAFNSLANLYSKQGKLGEAEKYYLLAIEKGHIEALKNLAVLFWQTNNKKEQSWRFITLHAETDRGKTLNSKIFRLIISAWVGLPYYPENRVKLLYEVIEHLPHLVSLFFYVLYHDTSDFLLEEFEGGKYSNFLQENHPLYYLIVLHFSRPDDARLLNIPAGLKESFYETVNEILEKRKYYSHGE